MRFPLPTQGCVLAFALLAGCSAPQNAATMPFSGSGANSAVTQSSSRVAVETSSALDSGNTPLHLLQLQAAGDIPGPITQDALKSELAYYTNHPDQQFPTTTVNGTVAVWATTGFSNFLVGLDETDRNVVKVINTGKNHGFEPVTVKVDHDQNVWVADQDSASHNGSVIQEYSKDGTYEAGYAWTPADCGTGPGRCFGYGYDSAENSTSVFAAAAFVYYKDRSGSDFGSGIFRFTNGNPSGEPTYYQVSDHKSHLNCNFNGCDQVFYMDVDSLGNVWFDFKYEDDATGQITAGLGELTANGTVSIIKPAGTYVFPGGVYVSNGGSVLNVTDQNNHKTYQYHLPVTSASIAFNVIGPTQPNVFGLGDPVSGGFNSDDSKITFGDAYGWIDHCAISSNTCEAIANINFPALGASGAAYTPSDK